MNETQAIRLCLRHRNPTGFEFLVNRYRREAFFHSLSLMGNRRGVSKKGRLLTLTAGYVGILDIQVGLCRSRKILEHDQALPETVH
jgi:hypothetical protein